MATIDSLTSDICREMEGKVFPMSQWEVGVKAPPFHLRCRTTTVPVFGDEFDKVGERAARGADGKIYDISGDMTYREWEKAFVDGDMSGLQEIGSGDKIGFMDITNEWTRTKGIKGTVIEKTEYIVNDTAYKVDGKHVILRPTEQEREVAAALSEKYGKHVEFVPQIMVPQGVQTPDYLIDGERFDLKAPTGRSKDLFYNVVSKKRK